MPSTKGLLTASDSGPGSGNMEPEKGRPRKRAAIDPGGSKYPIVPDFGPKDHTLNGFRVPLDPLVKHHPSIIIPFEGVL